MSGFMSSVDLGAWKDWEGGRDAGKEVRVGKVAEKKLTGARQK
jgi:hypothetical protein